MGSGAIAGRDPVLRELKRPLQQAPLLGDDVLARQDGEFGDGARQRALDRRDGDVMHIGERLAAMAGGDAVEQRATLSA